MIPPKSSFSQFAGTIKGRTVIWIFNTFPDLKTRIHGSNHFLAEGYCVDTVELDEEMIRKHIKQEKKERLMEKASSDQMGF